MGGVSTSSTSEWGRSRDRVAESRPRAVDGTARPTLGSKSRQARSKPCRDRGKLWNWAGSRPRAVDGTARPTEWEVRLGRGISTSSIQGPRPRAVDGTVRPALGARLLIRGRVGERQRRSTGCLGRRSCACPNRMRQPACTGTQFLRPTLEITRHLVYSDTRLRV